MGGKKISLIFAICVSMTLAGCFTAGKEKTDASSKKKDKADAAPMDGSGGADTESSDTTPESDTVSDPDGSSADAGPSCDGGNTYCTDRCVDTSTNKEHCGECDNACELNSGAKHMQIECVSGSCETRCDMGWVDADDNEMNGCELECKETNGGTEICDGKDNDCNGMVDDGFNTGSCTVGKGICQATGTYKCVSKMKAECDATAGMAKTETCGDQKDNDCDGKTDESDAKDAKTWYADSDGDGYGDPMKSKKACTQPMGYVDNKKDCDDGDKTVKPRQFFPDQDGDGYTLGTRKTKCSDASPPNGFAKMKSAKIDCNDSKKSINPGASEVCDGNDTNCDGNKDNISQSGTEGNAYYVDCDNDGFAPGTTGQIRSCSKPPSSKLSGACSSSTADWTRKVPNNNNTDCKDNNSDVFPGQTKWFTTSYGNNNWDYDCNGNAERKLSGKTNCASNPVTCQEGWDNTSSVGCGQSANYRGCHQDCSGMFCNFVCDSTSTWTTQGCR